MKSISAHKFGEFENTVFPVVPIISDYYEKGRKHHVATLMAYLHE